MIDLKQAIDIYYETYPTRKVESVLDVVDEWVIAGVDAQTGMAIDEPPLGISKDNGETRIFFPPANMNKLGNAVVVDKKEYSESDSI